MKRCILAFLMMMLASSLMAEKRLLAPVYYCNSGIQMNVSSDGNNVYLTFNGNDNSSCKYIVVEAYYTIGDMIDHCTVIAESMNDNSLLGDVINLDWFEGHKKDLKRAISAVSVHYSVGSFRMYKEEDESFLSNFYKKKEPNTVEITLGPKSSSSRKSWNHAAKAINPKAREIIRQAEQAQKNRNRENHTANNTGNYSGSISAGGSAGAYGSVSSGHGIDIKAAVEVKGIISINIH